MNIFINNKKFVKYIYFMAFIFTSTKPEQEKTLLEYLSTKDQGNITIEYILNKDDEKIINDTDNEFNILKEYFKKYKNDDENLENCKNLSIHLTKEHISRENLQENVNIYNVIVENLDKLNKLEQINLKDINNIVGASIKKTLIIDHQHYVSLVYFLLLIAKFLSLEKYKKIKNTITNNDNIKNFYEIYKKNIDNLKSNKIESINLIKNEIKKFTFESINLYECISNYDNLQKEFETYGVFNQKKLNRVEIMNLQEKYIDNFYKNSFLTITEEICVLIFDEN
jgi:hypothetical protein